MVSWDSNPKESVAMNEKEKKQAKRDLLRYRSGVVFNLHAAENRIERIRLEGKPEWYEWMEQASTEGKETCLRALDRYLSYL